MDNAVAKGHCNNLPPLTTNPVTRSSLLKPLTVIIKQMLLSGIFPEQLKIAKIIPLYKKGDKTNLTNYRPFSLLPFIWEKLKKSFSPKYTHFLKIIIYFIQSNKGSENLIQQYAYETLKLIERFLITMDTGKTPVGIFIYFLKLSTHTIIQF